MRYAIVYKTEREDGTFSFIAQGKGKKIIAVRSEDEVPTFFLISSGYSCRGKAESEWHKILNSISIKEIRNNQKPHTEVVLIGRKVTD